MGVQERQVSCNGKCACRNKVASYVCMFREYVEKLQEFKGDKVDRECSIVGLS